MRCPVVLAAIVLCFSPVHAAPSFDCTKANSIVETTICADSELSDLDVRMSDAFRSALSAGRMTVAAQRQWLKERDARCASPSPRQCLYTMMTIRVDELSLMREYSRSAGDDEVDVGGESYFVHPVSADRNSELLKTLHDAAKFNKIDGRIERCQRGIEFGFGGGRDKIYAGVCVFVSKGKERLVKACGDQMVGHFHIEDIGLSDITDKEMADFAANNCVGG